MEKSNNAREFQWTDLNQTKLVKVQYTLDTDGLSNIYITQDKYK